MPKLLSAERVREIKRLHGEIGGALRTSVEQAIRIGELLLAQKEECGHGHWEQWVAKNLPFVITTARNYMRAYRKREEYKTATVAGLAATCKSLYANPQPRPKKKKKRKAGDPKGVRSLDLTVKQAQLYDRLLSKLVEHADDKTPEQIVLTALRLLASEHKRTAA